MDEVVLWALPVFGVLMAAEFAWGLARGRNNYGVADTLANLSQGLLSQVVAVCTQFVQVGLYALAYPFLTLTPHWQLWHRWPGVVLAVLLIGVGGYLWLSDDTPGGPTALGGPFTLENGAGKTVTDRDIRGRYVLVYFGYTFCPDVCPTTLNAVADAMERLGPKADRVQPLFITVDPKRDTPAVVQQYAAAFGTRIVGLTGTPEQVADGITQLHEAGFRGSTLSFVDYVEEFPYFRDTVLPILEQRGIRIAPAAIQSAA